ncbi:O-acetylhomoserine/O-acetylserine sulfhydrylase [Nitzschia inconspicua]|uniref:O-acetylhomoserine/O-acetylserine sulfhydrylase n=1 Tax=Nitzschia inconspicua TaxID=303405 RepID=A0A9K3PFQ6_9STRA|nr:O-acetylhomoserine/O-acetylserine sulfhydrylase [Nitzschia inconspicua]
MRFITKTLSSLPGRLVRNHVYATRRGISSVDRQGFDTIALHGGYKPDTDAVFGLGHGAPRGIPVYRTTPFVFRSSEHAANLFALKELGNIYSRLMNPTNHVLESRYAQLEGAHELAGLAVASGTNAIFYAIITLAEAGDNIVSSRQLYGGTYTMFDTLLPKMGIEVRFVDGTDPASFATKADDKTRAFFTESCSNPSLDIFDIEAIASEAHALGLPLIVDSTFSTPYLCKPLEFGADVITNSATKWIGGHGVGLGGIIVDGGNFNWGAGKHPLFDAPDTSYGGLRWGHDLPEGLAPLAFKLRALTCNLRNLGGCLSPDNAWMLIQGIETLSLRMERHCENSLKVAEYLKSHPKVSWVRYPGLKDDPSYQLNEKYLKGKGGGIVVFGIKSDSVIEAGKKLIDSFELFSHVANVGDCKSLCIHPASTTHSQLSPEQQVAAGVPPDMVRLSIGIESVEDIIADLDHALAKVD